MKTLLPMLCAWILFGSHIDVAGTNTAPLPVLPNSYSMRVSYHAPKQENARETVLITSNQEYDIKGQTCREDKVDSLGNVDKTIIKVVRDGLGQVITLDRFAETCSKVPFEPAVITNFPLLTKDMKHEGRKEVDGIECSVWSKGIGDTAYKVWMNGTTPIQVYSAKAEAEQKISHGMLQITDFDGSNVHGIAPSRFRLTLCDEFYEQ